MQVDKLRARLCRGLYRVAYAVGDASNWLEELASRVEPIAPAIRGLPFHASGFFQGRSADNGLGRLLAFGPVPVPPGEHISLDVTPSRDFQPTRLVLPSVSAFGLWVSVEGWERWVPAELFSEVSDGPQLEWPRMPAGSSLTLYFKRGSDA